MSGLALEALKLALADWDRAEYSSLESTQELKERAVNYLTKAKALKSMEWCPHCRSYGTCQEWCTDTRDEDEQPPPGLVKLMTEPSVFEKEREFKSVHDRHCCPVHGCKYGDKLCPVELKTQKGIPCETCDGFWDDYEE